MQLCDLKQVVFTAGKRTLINLETQSIAVVLSNKLGTVAVSKENGNYCAAVNKIENGFFGELDAKYAVGHVTDADYAS